MRTLLVLLMIVLASAAAPSLVAQAQVERVPGEPVLDLALLPPMKPGGAAAYRDRFLLGNLPRAMAIASNGAFGARWDAPSLEAAKDTALKNCASNGGTDCAIYAENLDVVWKGRAAPERVVPGALLTGQHFAFVPDARYFWLPPQSARGVLVWAHGKGDGDARGLQPQPFVRAFNNAGFDVVRFDRDPRFDEKDDAADWLRGGLADLRKAGFRFVIAAGQSRGAWNVLQVLDKPGLADAVIAMSPAAQGADSPGWQIIEGETALWRVTNAADAPAARVVVAQFRGDPFYAEGDKRAALFERLRSRVGKLLLIDRPEGFEGHFGAASSQFAERYGACLLRFVTDPAPPPGC